MKDLEYFLAKEDEYLSKYGNEPDLIFNDFGELEPSDSNIPNSFLRQRLFHNTGYSDFPYKEELLKFDLSPIEIIVFRLFIGCNSYLFRDDNYSEVPGVVKEMQIVLDSVISKAPKYEGELLYRVLHDNDRIDFSLNDVFIPCFSLTCSKDKWKCQSNKYIIRPKGRETNAHSLYFIHNHGDEFQINFLKGTSFSVVKIEYVGEYKHIFLDEI